MDVFAHVSLMIRWHICNNLGLLRETSGDAHLTLYFLHLLFYYKQNVSRRNRKYENIVFLCLLEKTIIIDFWRVSITQRSETDERAEMLLV